jgi:putative oxidoreductase
VHPNLVERSPRTKVTHFLLRLVAGALFIHTGGHLLFGWAGSKPPALTTQMEIGGVLEFVGGLATVLGLFMVPVAFLLSGMMAVAYWQFHFPQSIWPLQNQGMPAILMCFIYLHLAATGAGPWSLDAYWRRRTHPDSA